MPTKSINKNLTINEIEERIKRFVSERDSYHCNNYESLLYRLREFIYQVEKLHHTEKILTTMTYLEAASDSLKSYIEEARNERT
jgi:hypothetical protein